MIKINGNYDRCYPGSNTSSWFFGAVCDALISKGLRNIQVIEGDLPYFKATDMIKRTGLYKVIDKYNVSFIPIEHFARDSSNLPLAVKMANLVNMPVFHSHGLAVMSCATKNLFGLLPKDRRRYHKHLTEKLIELWHSLDVFTIVDGTVGLIGESTRRGKPVRLDVVISGWDTLAIDYVAAKIMGFEPAQIPLLKYAIENQLLKERQIELRGDFTWKTLPHINFKFKVSPQRKAVMNLESTFLENIPVFRWFETKMERVYHRLVYLRKKKELFNGPWMEYARCDED
jgi:uncharacterized protein (DUF362 family)